MTPLGFVFLVAFAVGAVRGRALLLLAVATAAPFNDSAMVVVGSVVVSPFYVGVLIYLGSGVLTKLTGRRSATSRPMRRSARAAGTLFWYSAFITATAPLLFSGVGVVAAGLGLDQQVERLSPLRYTSSNVAQICYLGLNVLMILESCRLRVVTESVVRRALAAGTVAAAAALFCRYAGIRWPAWIFDNSPRNFYATIDPRLRGEFAEPSHLGAFAVVASFYFVARFFQPVAARERRGSLIFGTAAVSVLIASGSGTALIGVIVAAGSLMMVAMVWGFPHLRNGIRLQQRAALAVMVMATALVGLAPAMYRFLEHAVREKERTSSFSTRTYTDHIAIRLFEHSYFLGVGLGSNRASSLLYLLLSTVGLVGSAAFGVLLLTCVRNSATARGQLPLLCGLIASLAAAFVSYADLASPILWLLIAATYPSWRQRPGQPAEPERRSPTSASFTCPQRPTRDPAYAEDRD